MDKIRRIQIVTSTFGAIFDIIFTKKAFKWLRKNDIDKYKKVSRNYFFLILTLLFICITFYFLLSWSINQWQSGKSHLYENKIMAIIDDSFLKYENECLDIEDYGYYIDNYIDGDRFFVLIEDEVVKDIISQEESQEHENTWISRITMLTMLFLVLFIVTPFFGRNNIFKPWYDYINWYAFNIFAMK